MNLTFNGKTAIVTGAASGIGAAIAEELAASGATVVIADLNIDHAQARADKITAAGGKALAFVANVADPEAVSALIDFAVSETGALHLLVNNAGVSGPAAPIGEYPIDGWKQVIDVNLNGVFYGMRYAIPVMKAAGGGAIVNIASMLGSIGIAGSSAYVAAKHAIVGMTKNAALEHSSDNIRITAVGPGFIATPLLKQNLDAATRTGLEESTPMRRMGTPEEVAGMVAYLLSDRASFVTGSYHLIDGGYTAQ